MVTLVIANLTRVRLKDAWIIPGSTFDRAELSVTDMNASSLHALAKRKSTIFDGLSSIQLLGPDSDRFPSKFDSIDAFLEATQLKRKVPTPDPTPDEPEPIREPEPSIEPEPEPPDVPFFIGVPEAPPPTGEGNDAPQGATPKKDAPRR